MIGIRKRIFLSIFSVLFLAMALFGVYRYFNEKNRILEYTRSQGEQSGKILAGLAVPCLKAFDYVALRNFVQSCLNAGDLQEVSIFDGSGREVIRAARPALADGRLALGPFPISEDQATFGQMRTAVYPADLDNRLTAYVKKVFLEHVLFLLILSALLFFFISRAVASPLREMSSALEDVLNRGDFTHRVEAHTSDEIGSIVRGINSLTERFDQFAGKTAAIAGRINDLAPVLSESIEEMRGNTDTENEALSSAVSSVEKISSAIKSVAESAGSLSTSAEETSSAMLEMNASNQEVVRHTGELTSSVEEVTTSVMEMIAAIKEVAGHVESLSTSAEQTAASAVQIEATVREVEQAARESSQLSHQVSVEAGDIGVGAIRQIAGSMNRIRESVNNYSDLITRLGKRSEEIGKILGVIVEVTERTNLLALNASILAAQAGEQGRGFAVVAEQIKALADRTAGSAQDIAQLIKTVQKETREAVAAMTDSLSAVEEGVSRTQEADAAVSKILASAGRSADTANMIERAMTEQSRGVKQVSEAASNVKQMLAQIASATQAQSQGSEMILRASEEMRDIARQVHKSILEQERGGKHIAEEAENVTVRAGKIATATREQEEAGSRMIETLERMRELPGRNIKRMERLAGTSESLREQARILSEEVIRMRGRKLSPEPEKSA